MLYDEDTLAYHRKERPGCLIRDMSGTLLSQAGKKASSNVHAYPKETPESEALEFYVLNHAMADIALRYEPEEPLGNALPIVEEYHDVLNRIGSRMFHYLLITTTREMRHLGGHQEDQLDAQFGSKCTSFTKNVKNYSQEALYDYGGELTLGEYTDYLCHVYDDLSWGSSYGGKAWGKVTHCLNECVQGTISIEMMLDTAFTLAHNNGPIFNKGYQYQMYDSKALLTILDCQRGGQIPNLIKAGSGFCNRITSSHVALVARIEKALGKEYRNWVQWDMVETLGALGTYTHFKKKNAAQFAHDPSYMEDNKELFAKIEAEKEAALMKQVEIEKTQLEISPGVFVKKMEKKR